MATDLGKIAITLEGSFDPDQIYNKLDQVTNNGSSYTSKIDNNDQPLSNPNAWQISAEKGIDGIDGVDGTNAQSFNYKNNVDSYSNLPASGNLINDAYYNLEDNLLYVYNGTSFPIEGSGINLKGVNGTAEIPVWIAQPYLQNALVQNNGVYQALEDTLSTDVPGISLKWTALKIKPESIGAIEVFEEINVSLTFTDNAYIDEDGVLQTLSSYEVSDFIELPLGENEIEVDYGSMLTIAEFSSNSMDSFIRNVGTGGFPNPDEIPFNYTPTDSEVKFVRYSHYKLNGTAYFKITNNRYELPWLKTNTNEVDEFPKICKIGDVKLLDFNDYTLTGNVIISGDSTIASYLGGSALASIIENTGVMTDISEPGENIEEQVDRWNALSSQVKSAANFVFVQIGLNNINIPATPTTTIIAELNSYIQTINTESPNAFIVVGQMLPCKARWIASFGETNGNLAHKQWEEINKEMLSISNVNSFATVHTWLLNDGKGNLRAEFETSANDHIHDNTNGRKMNAYSWLISVY